MIFRLITEGPTDQTVLRYILAKYFAEPDIDVRPVQPNTDSTDTQDHLGGWSRVMKYCNSLDMAMVLEADGCVVIQIDTDRCEDYGVVKRVDGRDKTEAELIGATKATLIDKIGEALYERHSDKIAFAISHESIECWLLPLYYNDNSRTKTVNCCNKLNQELVKEGFTLDCENKKEKYYHKICKKIKNKTHVEAISGFNSSFNEFIQNLAKTQN